MIWLLILAVLIGIGIERLIHPVPREGIQVFDSRLAKDPQFIQDLAEAAGRAYQRIS